MPPVHIAEMPWPSKHDHQESYGKEICSPSLDRNNGYAHQGRYTLASLCLVECPIDLQVDNGPMGSQTDHLVEVIRSYSNLSFANVESIDGIPPSLSQSLNQYTVACTLKKKPQEWPEANRIHQSLCLGHQGLIPREQMASTTPTRVRLRTL